METKFQVNDKVEWCGLVGRVETIVGNHEPAMLVKFDNGDTQFFVSDGRYLLKHTKPSLTLIERLRKTKKVKGWIAIGPTKGSNTVASCNGFLYKTKQGVERMLSLSPDIIIQEIEVEVYDEA